MLKPMRIVCAPDSFKGSLTALDAARAMERGIRRALPNSEIVSCPVADGGEGTVRALVGTTGGELRRTTVSGPRGEEVSAEWGWLGGEESTAVIEMAAASGLTLVPERERDASRASTFGTGQLIRAALDAGATRIILGLGGSATNDGGCGAAQALGVSFLDHRGERMDDPITGADLLRIGKIDREGIDSRLDGLALSSCSDVDNPLTGPNGASAIYGPQKGAGPEMVEVLDAGLLHVGAIWRDQLAVDVIETPGSGSAGGMGGGVVAMLGARARSGIELILETCALDRKLEGSALCLTGEGRLDGQSVQGKACFGVARVAANAGVPVTGFFGSIASDAPDEATRTRLGMTHAHEIAGGIAHDDAMRRAAELLEHAVAEALAKTH
jgi:glycerate kinase